MRVRRVLTKMLGAVEAQLDDFDMLQLKLVWWALGRLSVRPKRNVLELFFGRITGLLVDLDALVRAAADLSLSVRGLGLGSYSLTRALPVRGCTSFVCLCMACHGSACTAL